MQTLATILHPTDFSACAGHALELAASLARIRKARLVVLHVMAVPLVEEKRGYREEMEQELEGLRVPGALTAVERRLEVGDPAAAILRVAGELEADLIVMGTHGRTGLDRLLMGSVAEQVLRETDCPVLTVKASATRPKSGAPAWVPEAQPAGTALS